jgi:hypothetical protein
VDTGLPEEKPVAELTEAEGEQLCEATQMAADDLVSSWLAPESLCTVVGLSLAVMLGGEESFQDVCEATRDACIEDPPEELTMLDAEDSLDVSECDVNVPEGCDATVGDFESCIGAVFGELEQVFAPLSSCNTTPEAAQEALMGFENMDGAEITTDLPQCEAVEACDSEALSFTPPRLF